MSPFQHPNAPAREAYNHLRSLGAEIVDRLDPDEVEMSDRERLCLWLNGHLLAKAWVGAEFAGEDLPDPARCPADPDYFLPWGRPRRGEARKWYEISKTWFGSEFGRVVPDLLVTLEELHSKNPLLTPDEKETLLGSLSDFLQEGRGIMSRRAA